MSPEYYLLAVVISASSEKQSPVNTTVNLSVFCTWDLVTWPLSAGSTWESLLRVEA